MVWLEMMDKFLIGKAPSSFGMNTGEDNSLAFQLGTHISCAIL